jgi:anaerobic magnesium-protoporphyrin IX monomethyl ester cyclase
MCLLRMREAAFRMIALAREWDCAIVVAGADATDHPQLYLERGADYVVIGEGEETLAELLDHLSGHGTVAREDIRGLAFAGPEGVRRTPRRPDLRDLDRLPFPAWDLVDLERYRAIWRERHGYFSLNLVTSRGCPYHCNWCAKPIWGQRYHARSPENVVAEMAWLKRICQPDHLWVVDDIFGLQPGWLDRFADLLDRHDARVPFKCLQRADLLLKNQTVEALRRAGATTVWIGAESGSQKVLDAMDKGTTVEQIRAAAESLHRAGIEVGFFLQFGYPGETLADVELTLRLVRECRPDDIGMSVSYPLPGTRFHAAVKAELGRQQNWRDSDDLAMLYRGPYPTAFYRKLHTVLHHEFRARKAWGEVRSALRRPAKLRPCHLRRLLSLTAHLAALPLERWHLGRLAREDHDGVRSLPRLTGSEMAARPTPPGESG